MVPCKARIRVTEWRRRRAEELKAQAAEQATFEQKLRAEAVLEAARQLAAARAEEAERRLVAEQENRAEMSRAAQMSEKWASNSREKERRRAEIYAINAVMRWVSLSPAVVLCVEVDLFLGQG